MKVIIELLKQDTDLACFEAVSLLDIDTYSLKDNYLIANVSETNSKYFTRLAYARNVNQFLFLSSFDDIEQNSRKFDFTKLIDGSFKINCLHFNDEKKYRQVIKDIWHSLKKPIVSLDNPKVQINFIRLGDEIICSKHIVSCYQDFKSRLPHKREGFRPISLQPRLARCLVNLTGVKNSSLVDPFCGIGGIPIEALLMDVKTEAFDIDEVMVRITEHSIKKFSIDKKLYKVKKHDFFKIKRKIKYLAADLPYGKNTRNLDTDFYVNVLRHLSIILGNRAAIIFPHWIDVEKILKKEKIKLKIMTNFTQYIHKSMSRVIYVFERGKI